MKRIAIAAYVLACCTASSQAWAQNCKPAFSETDKLSKEKYDVWGTVLSDKGSFMGTSRVGIVATIWRQGNVNQIQLRVDRTDTSAVNAGLASPLRGTVGKPFYLGFKTGAPLAFEVTGVENTGGVQQGLFAATGLNRAFLRSAVSDRALAALREALVSRQIDSVRAALEGDVRIEASVDDRVGKKMMQQFSCFYQSLDRQGISLSAAVDPPAEAGQPASGAGAAENPMAAAPRAAPGPVTLRTAAGTQPDEIFKMLAAKLPEETILLQVRKAGGTVNLSTDDLIRLKQAGATDQFVRSLLQGEVAQPAVPQASASRVQPAVPQASASRVQPAPDSKGGGPDDPETLGVPYFIDEATGKLRELERQNVDVVSYGGIIRGGRTFIRFKGIRSAVRFQSGSTMKFVLRTGSTSADPNSLFNLDRLTSVDGQREATTGKGRRLGRSEKSTTGETAIPVNSTPCGRLSVCFTSATRLVPGEYLVRLATDSNFGFLFGVD